MISIKVDETKCDGCGNCQVACSLIHADSIEAGNANTSRIGHYPPLLWIYNKYDFGYSITICRHCEEPVCRDACIAGAIEFRRNGNTQLVIINTEKCVGCWSCVMECPFASIKIGAWDEKLPESTCREVAYKCDGCIGWEKPLCVLYCPTGALEASNNSSLSSARQRRKRSKSISYGIGK